MDLKYDDLMKDLERDVLEKGLVITDKNGEQIVLRPLRLLHDAELKMVQTLVKKLGDEEDLEKQVEMAQKAVACAADKKDKLKAFLADFPPLVRMDIFNQWIGGEGEPGESSDSES